MPSTLAWLDHDASARERTKRILALFQERGTQDQLGLGGIRDSFADLLFPGTSTIQTRLRYFLFVPWIYRRIEQDEVPSRRVAAVAREREVALVEPLLSQKEEGVFGREAGGELKRLPSEVYWGGLGSWGIRRFDASRERYHRALDEIYRRRTHVRRPVTDGAGQESGVVTWHADLPAPPPSFPERVTLSVTREEAEFLRDRIVAEHPTSLLAWLALHPSHTDVAYPWEHPQLALMGSENRRILDHARMFSEVMYGAPVLYNLMLAEEGRRADLKQRYGIEYGQWAKSLNTAAVAAWSLADLFRIARGQGSHAITPTTEEFVRGWVEIVRAGPTASDVEQHARQLVRRREGLLKGRRSLFLNRKALAERYRGGLGMARLAFRWSDVQVLLNDLYDGFAAS